MNLDRLVARVKKDEGFSPVAYWDREQWTFGYGCRAPGEGATITEAEAETLLLDELWEAVHDYESIYYDCMGVINDVRAEALTNMAFNLGKTKLLKFRKMNAAIHRGDWMEAAYQARDSTWFTQVGKRAQRIVKELATGEKESV